MSTQCIGAGSEVAIIVRFKDKESGLDENGWLDGMLDNENSHFGYRACSCFVEVRPCLICYQIMIETSDYSPVFETTDSLLLPK